MVNRKIIWFLMLKFLTALSHAGASSSSAMDVATSGAGLILAAPQHERGIRNEKGSGVVPMQTLLLGN
jgi:hypothetical protein